MSFMLSSTHIKKFGCTVVILLRKSWALLHFQYHYLRGSVYQCNGITRMYPKKSLTVAFSFNIFKFIHQNLKNLLLLDCFTFIFRNITCMFFLYYFYCFTFLSPFQIFFWLIFIFCTIIWIFVLPPF